MLDRRSVLLGGTAVFLAPRLAWGAGTAWRVVALADRPQPLEARLAEAGFPRGLRIARLAGRYALVADPARAPAALLDGATAASGPVETLWNVSYGVGAHRDALVRDASTVVRRLGPRVAERLVIERSGSRLHALVYRRLGARGDVLRTVERHRRLLAPAGLDAALIEERGRPILTWIGGEPPVASAPARIEAPSKARAPRMEQGGTALEGEVEALIKAARGRGEVAADEHTSWLAWDLDGDRPLLTINAGRPRQLASMVKPLVVLAFFAEAARGRFVYGPRTRARFEAMIQRSSNTETDRAIDLIGGPARVQAVLVRDFPHLFHDLSIVEKLGRAGRTYRNRASAADLGRFLRALWRRELPSAEEILRLMGLPGSDRLTTGVPGVPRGTRVYDKTGSTSRLCGDMGILDAPFPRGRRRFLVVGIIEKDRRARSYGPWLRARSNVIRAVSHHLFQALGEGRDRS